MSESEQEQGEATEAPEPSEDDEAAPEQEDDAEGAQEPTEEPAGGDSLDAQREQADEAYVKLDKRAKNYFASATGVLEDSPLPLSVCELCADAYPGLRWLEPRDDAHRIALDVFHGTQDLESLKAVEWAIRCRGCDGRGFVKTGSLIAGNEAIRCRKCNGAGYEVLDQDTGVVVPPPTSNGDTVAAPLAGVNAADPRIAEFVAEGWTMIPPMGAVAPPGVT